MKNARTLCIDFGSAYTKVAIRSGWNNEAELLADLPNAPKEMSFCIPTVVMKVDRRGGTRWAAGETAASQESSDGVTIYRDWKSKLFSHQSSRADLREYSEVGVAFFRELRSAIRQMRLPIDVDECPTRVCIPHLSSMDGAQQRIVDIIREAGWNPASNRPAVFEPETNAIGVFTRGRNATWFPDRPAASRNRHPYLMKMFELQGLLGAIRANRDHYGVMVVDVGAYTTDFGYIKFDTDIEKRPKITQISQEIGVRELDRAVQAEVRDEVCRALATMPVTQWERMKVSLYQGTPVAVRNPQGGILKVGEGQEGREIAAAITAFGKRIAEAEEVFRADLDGPLNAYVLTGGGTMIPAVRKTLVTAADRAGTKFIYDLLDPEEPDRVLLRKQDKSGKFYLDQRDVETRLRQSRELTRGGSAIGGCSVFFE